MQAVHILRCSMGYFYEYRINEFSEESSLIEKVQDSPLLFFRKVNNKIISILKKSKIFYLIKKKQ